MEKTDLTRNIPIDITEEEYQAAIKPCIDLAISRNKKYGNSIDIMRTPSILDLILMKLIRTSELDTEDPKYYDEIIDSINYLVYILLRRRKLGSLRGVSDDLTFRIDGDQIQSSLGRTVKQSQLEDDNVSVSGDVNVRILEDEILEGKKHYKMHAPIQLDMFNKSEETR